LTAVRLLQVLRLAEAHIKHEKEELKSLNVVLGGNSEKAVYSDLQQKNTK
jgi:hypothetical protein